MRIRKVISKIVIMVLMINVFSFVCFADGDNDTMVDMIDIIKNSEISSRDELADLLEQYGISVLPVSEPDLYTEVDFSISIEDDSYIVVNTLYEGVTDRSTKYGKASHEVYNTNGYLIYTIVAKGSFSYGSGYCNVTGQSGRFDRATGSFWSSTPSVTSGHVNATKAYVKVSGTATCSGCTPRPYTLYLYCTSGGTLSSAYYDS